MNTHTLCWYVGMSRLRMCDMSQVSSFLVHSEHYLATVTWVTDTQIAVQWLRRVQNHLILQIYNFSDTRWEPVEVQRDSMRKHTHIIIIGSTIIQWTHSTRQHSFHNHTTTAILEQICTVYLWWFLKIIFIIFFLALSLSFYTASRVEKLHRLDWTGMFNALFKMLLMGRLDAFLVFKSV